MEAHPKVSKATLLWEACVYAIDRSVVVYLVEQQEAVPQRADYDAAYNSCRWATVAYLQDKNPEFPTYSLMSIKDGTFRNMRLAIKVAQDEPYDPKKERRILELVRRTIRNDC